MYQKLLNWKCVVEDKLSDGSKLRKNQLKSLVKLFNWLGNELEGRNCDQSLLNRVNESLSKCNYGLEMKGLHGAVNLSFLFYTMVDAASVLPDEKFLESRKEFVRQLHSVRDRVDYLLVCDLEMTCDEGVNHFPSETLDVGMVVLDARTLEQVDRYESLVKPVVRPLLSKFCESLTGVTQEMVDNEREYPEVAQELQNFLKPYTNARFVQWGKADSKQLKKDDERCGLESTLCGVEPFNLKDAFTNFKCSKVDYSLNKAMSVLGFERYGMAHRAYSDAVDTSLVARYLFEHVEMELA
ncbi:exonuclease domain-containing protein [Vibrio owensii]|uniref:exonuclease domain-containing protein n=1 Tax=Vibrio harveyi group TaxID=717610 RepID=UPI003CC61610